MWATVDFLTPTCIAVTLLDRPRSVSCSMVVRSAFVTHRECFPMVRRAQSCEKTADADAKDEQDGGLIAQ